MGILLGSIFSDGGVTGKVVFLDQGQSMSKMSGGTGECELVADQELGRKVKRGEGFGERKRALMMSKSA